MSFSRLSLDYMGSNTSKKHQNIPARDTSFYNISKCQVMDNRFLERRWTQKFL